MMLTTEPARRLQFRNIACGFIGALFGWATHAAPVTFSVVNGNNPITDILRFVLRRFVVIYVLGGAWILYILIKEGFPSVKR
jgi:hypothetical protein